MRKLASIQKIKDIIPIAAADRIEVAQVLGWQCVVDKGEFKPGDYCVYFEIDSFLPIQERYEFLRKNSFKHNVILGDGFRLKTVKMRGQISQGLCLPIRSFPELCERGWKEGMDVTEILKVRKWEEPEVAGLGGDKKGSKPGWIETSNETRIQAEPELLQEFAGIEYYITTKYDGISHFIAVDEEDQFRAGSHRLELRESNKEGSFWKWLKDREIPEKLISLKKELGATRFYVIGEWCGAGIQKNKLQLQKPQWYPFTACIDDRRMSLQELRDICEKIGVEMVSVEEIGYDLPSKYPTIDALLERASLNLNKTYPGECEGIVIRPTSSYYTKKIQTPVGIKEYPNQILSMKVINNKYLLKGSD